MQSVIGNITNTETKKQGLRLPPPPLHASKRKAPQDSFRSYIDQGPDDYGSAKLVKNNPQKTADSYFLIKTRATSIRSFRRNKTHISVALFRNKKDGPKRSNIAYLRCSFLELDGSTDSTIKNKSDIDTLVSKNNLPEPSDVIETSKGHFHILWTYNNPLPWKPKNESYWTSQQKRLIQVFKKDGFNVDVSASLNPVQNLRNPSQLQPYNFKRRCKVLIHKSYSKTSLRLIFRALNATNIPNPKPIQADTKLRQFSRANKTFTGTHKELAIKLGFSPRTSKREIKKAIKNGDLRIVARVGNNSEKTRTTQYESLLFIERFPEVPLVSSKNNYVRKTDLLTDFQENGAVKGYRNKTLFALGLYLKCLLGERASIGAIRAELLRGARACHVPEKEFERTLKNVMKSSYTNPLGLPKLRAWGLLERRKITEISLH